MAVVEDPLDCLATHCVVLAAWDDQADVEDPEEDLTCSRPEVLEVSDQAWDGPVDQVVAVCQVLLRCIRGMQWIRLDGHRLDSRRIGERLMNG